MRLSSLKVRSSEFQMRLSPFEVRIGCVAMFSRPSIQKLDSDAIAKMGWERSRVGFGNARKSISGLIEASPVNWTQNSVGKFRLWDSRFLAHGSSFRSCEGVFGFGCQRSHLKHALSLSQISPTLLRVQLTGLPSISPEMFFRASLQPTPNLPQPPPLSIPQQCNP
jgi:hypothetical protein